MFVICIPSKKYYNLGLSMDKKTINSKIKELKKKQNAIILAHNYQIPGVQDVADFVGDSLDLSLKATKTDAEIIIFCGVDFMAESAKILNPDKNVIIPDKDAKCPMAGMVDAESLKWLKQEASLFANNVGMRAPNGWGGARVAESGTVWWK